MKIEEMIDAVRDCLEDFKFNYEYIEEQQLIRFGIALESKLKQVQVLCEFRPFGYIVYTTSSISADAKNLKEVLRFIAMANNGLINGNFDVDCRNGEISYRCFLCTKGLKHLPLELIQDSLGVGSTLMEHYGDSLARLAMGFSDAETEIKKIEDAG